MALKFNGTMIREFFGWWCEQLATLLPAVVRGRNPDAAGFVVLDLQSPLGVSPATIEVTQPGRKHLPLDRQTLTLTETGLGQLRSVLGPALRIPSRLRLPVGILLQRDVVLPIAAEYAPDQVLQYELDRLTPFRTDEVFWSYRVIQRDRVHGRLHLRLTLALREALAPLLETLRSAGVAPGQLEARSAPGGAWRRIELGVTAERRRRPMRRVALALCAGLALAVVVTPFVRQSLALAAAQARIDALAPAMAEASGLRQLLAAAAAGGDVMQAARQRLGDPLQAVVAVTEALPDDTFLTNLTLHQRRLTLDGQSAAAVKLIARLSSEPAIRNPAFTAPVTRSDGGRADQFSIGAELTP
jgi:general secretion pathway protein L